MSSPIAGSPSARSRTPPNVCFLIDSSCPYGYQHGQLTKASAELYVNDIKVSVLRTLLYFYYYVDSRFRWGYQFVHTIRTLNSAARRVHGFREFREIEFQGFLAELRDEVHEGLENAATSEGVNGKGETQIPLGILTESLKKGLTDFKWNQVDFLNTDTIISPMKPHTRTAWNSSCNGGSSYPPATVKHYTYLFTECPKTYKDLLYHVDGSETSIAQHGHRSYWSEGLELELEGLLDRVQEAWMGKALWDVYMTERIALSWIDTATISANGGEKNFEPNGECREMTSEVLTYTEIVHQTMQAIMRAYGGTLISMKDITKAQEVLPYSAMFQYARNKMLEPDRELRLVSTEKMSEPVKDVDTKNETRNRDWIWEGQMITKSHQEEPLERISITISRLLIHPKNATRSTFADKLKGRAGPKSIHPAQSMFSPSLESIAVISSIPSKHINPLWCTASSTLSKSLDHLPTSALDPPIFTCTPSKRSPLADKTKFISLLKRLKLTGRVLIVKIEPTDGGQGGAKLAILEPILKAVASLQLMSSHVKAAELVKLAERVEEPGMERMIPGPADTGVGPRDVPAFRPVLLEKWSSTMATTFRLQLDAKSEQPQKGPVKSISLDISLPPHLDCDKNENDTSMESIAQLGNESFSSISDLSVTGCESSNARTDTQQVDDVQNGLKSIETLFSEFTHNYMNTLYSFKISLVDFVQNTIHELKTGIQSVDPPPEKTALIVFLQTHIFKSLSDIDKKHKYLLSLSNEATKRSTDAGRGAALIEFADDTSLQIDDREEPYLKSWYSVIMHKRCLTNDMLRKKIDGLRAREAQLQIILILELLHMEIQNPGIIGTTSSAETEIKARSVESGKRAKKRRSNPEPDESGDLRYRLETFIDRVCLWFETGAGGLYEDILNSTRSAGDFLQGDDVDGLRLFVTKVIDRYYKEALPDIVAEWHRKCGLDSMYPISPAKFIEQQSLMEREEESNRSERMTRRRARLPILANKPETDLSQTDDAQLINSVVPIAPASLGRTKSAPVKQRKSRSMVADSLANFGSKRPGIAINNALFRNREVVAAMVKTAKRKKGTTPKKQKPKSQVLVQNKCTNDAMPSTRQRTHNRVQDHDDSIFRTPGKRQRRTPHRTTASPKIIPQTPAITTPTRARILRRTDLPLSSSRYPITPRNKTLDASPFVIPQTPCSGRSLKKSGSKINTPTPPLFGSRRNSVNEGPSPYSRNRTPPFFRDRFTVAATPETKSARKGSVSNDASSTPRKRKRVVHSDAEDEEADTGSPMLLKGECGIRRKLVTEFMSQ